MKKLLSITICLMLGLAPAFGQTASPSPTRGIDRNGTGKPVVKSQIFTPPSTTSGTCDLVYNGNFETYSVCPTNGTQLTGLTGWTEPTLGSSDYYNCPPWPYNGYSIMGFATPHSGKGFTGLYAYDNGGNYREYIQSKLTCQMVAGQSYSLSFWTMLGNSSVPVCGNLGMYLSATNINQANSLPLIYTPQANYPGIISNASTWTLVTNPNYIATGNENYVTVGNFYTDANTLHGLNTNTGSFLIDAYYYIDDVSVTPNAPTINASATTIACGSSATLTASGAGSYSWSTGATTASIVVSPTTTTTYTVQSMSACGACPLISTVTVTVPSTPCTGTYTYNAPTTILSNLTINGTTCAVNADLTIPTGVSLTFRNSTVTFAPGVRIVVQNGATLTVNGSYLHACTSTCPVAMWYGLEVQPGGAATIFNYSIIEDATYGVYADASTTTDIPYLDLYHAVFNKNANGVVINDNPNDVNSGLGYIFSDCIFTCRTLSSTAATAANYAFIKSDLYSGTPTEPATITLFGERSGNGIVLNNLSNAASYKVGVAGATTAGGVGYLTIFDNLDFGCYINGSYATIKNCLFQNLTGNISANSNYGGLPFGVGVYGYNRANRSWPYIINIGGSVGAFETNVFRNCFRGIDISNTDFINITGNTFGNTTTSPLTSFANPTPQLCSGEHGIFLKPTCINTASSILISSNAIRNCAYGIQMTRTSGYNATMLQLSCNSITSGAAANQYCQQGIFLQDASGNTPNIPAKSYRLFNNTITNVIHNAIICDYINAGLDINTNNELSQLYAPAPAPPNTIITNGPVTSVIQLDFCSNAGVENNKDITTSQNNLITNNELLAGINLNGGSGLNVNNNFMWHLGTDVLFNATTGTTTVFQNNAMANSMYGLFMFNNAVFNTQGSAGVPAGNKWGVFPTSLTGNQTYSNSSITNTNAKIYVSNAACSGTYCTNPTSNGGAFPYTSTGLIPTTGIAPSPTPCPFCSKCDSLPPFTKQFTAGGGIPETDANSNASNDLAELIKGSQTDLVSTEQKWNTTQYAFSQLYYNKVSFSGDEGLRKLYSETFTAPTGKLVRVEEMIATGNYAEALKLNASIAGANLIEMNHARVNHALLKKLLNPDYIYSAKEKEALKALANSCSITNGAAVYRARAVYNAIINGTELYADNCPALVAGIEPSAEMNNASVKIYPNPNNGSMTIEYKISNADNALLEIYNLRGEKVSSYLLKPDTNLLSINDSNLSNGVYMYRFISNEQTLNTGRLVIVK